MSNFSGEKKDMPVGLTGTAKIEWIDKQMNEIISFIEEQNINEDEYAVKLNDELMKYFIKLSQAREAEEKRIQAEKEFEYKKQKDTEAEEYRKEQDEIEQERWQKEFDLKEAEAARRMMSEQAEQKLKEEEIKQKSEESKNRMIADIAKYGLIALGGAVTAGIAGAVMVHCCHVSAGVELTEGGAIVSPHYKKYGYASWQDCQKVIQTPHV